MKKFLRLPLLFILTLGAAPLFAQTGAIDKAFQTATVERLCDLLNAQYVYPEVAKKTGEHLQKQLKAGYFNDFAELPSFAAVLTKEAQSVANDRHLRIRVAPPRVAPAGTTESLIENKLEDLEFQRSNMAGFREVKRLDGNIGYFDLRGFAPVPAGAPVADRYMGLLAGVDAIIIDLRRNGGGSPDMVQYLCSYFFDKHIHLNSLYWREGNETREFWTLDKVGGEKMPDVPLFILTSAFTFSGAEEFCYNMQTRKRATLVGETTGGGANPGGMFPINDRLGVFIPTGAAINPVTKTNWEGAGVVPEVKTAADEAFGKALELAKTAAAEYRAKTRARSKEMFVAVMAEVEKIDAGAAPDGLVAGLKSCLDAGILTEDDINGLGYEYLQNLQKPATAAVIFKANTILFPNSANACDSYGEALLATGKPAEAVKSYQKAVALAEKNKDPNLELFKTNLKAAEKSAGKRP